MFTWRLQLREARVACQSGRYEDAIRLLSRESLREFLPDFRHAAAVGTSVIFVVRSLAIWRGLELPAWLVKRE